MRSPLNPAPAHPGTPSKQPKTKPEQLRLRRWRYPWRFYPWRYRWAEGTRGLLQRQWPGRPVQTRGLGLVAPQLLWQRRRPGNNHRRRCPPTEALPHCRSGATLRWLRHPWRAGRRQKRGRSWRDDWRLWQSRLEGRWLRDRWRDQSGEEQRRREAKAQRAAAARRRRHPPKRKLPEGPRQRRPLFRRRHQQQLRQTLQLRRRPNLGRRWRLLGSGEIPQRQRRRRHPAPLNWRLLSHRFGFWVHFIKYPKQRYRLKALRRKLLWSWQRPQRPGRLPRPRGKAPVIPLISEALNPPPEPLPGPSSGPNLRFGGRYGRGWSALPERPPEAPAVNRRRRLRFWYQLPESPQRQRRRLWPLLLPELSQLLLRRWRIGERWSRARYWRRIGRKTAIWRILFRYTTLWPRRRLRGRRRWVPYFGWVPAATRRKGMGWFGTTDFYLWLLRGRPPEEKRELRLSILRWGLAPRRRRQRRRLSRRFESQRLAAAASGRGLTWLRGGSAAGRRRPSRRPRQLTGGGRRGWTRRYGEPHFHRRRPQYRDLRLHRATEAGDGPQYRGYRSLRRGGMHGIRHLANTTPLRRPLQQLQRLQRLHSFGSAAASAAARNTQRRRSKKLRLRLTNTPLLPDPEVSGGPPEGFRDSPAAARRRKSPPRRRAAAALRRLRRWPLIRRLRRWPLFVRRLQQRPIIRWRRRLNRRNSPFGRWRSWRVAGLGLANGPPGRQSFHHSGCLRWGAELATLHQLSLDHGEMPWRRLGYRPSGGPLLVGSQPTCLRTNPLDPERRLDPPLYGWKDLRSLRYFRWSTQHREQKRPKGFPQPSWPSLGKFTAQRGHPGDFVRGPAGGPRQLEYLPVWGSLLLLWGSPLEGRYWELEPTLHHYRGLDQHSRWGYLRLPIFSPEQIEAWLRQKGDLSLMDPRNPKPGFPSQGKWYQEVEERYRLRTVVAIRSQRLRQGGRRRLVARVNDPPQRPLDGSEVYHRGGRRLRRRWRRPRRRLRWRGRLLRGWLRWRGRRLRPGETRRRPHRLHRLHRPHRSRRRRPSLLPPLPLRSPTPQPPPPSLRLLSGRSGPGVGERRGNQRRRWARRLWQWSQKRPWGQDRGPLYPLLSPSEVPQRDGELLWREQLPHRGGTRPPHRRSPPREKWWRRLRRSTLQGLLRPDPPRCFPPPEPYHHAPSPRHRRRLEPRFSAARGQLNRLGWSGQLRWRLWSPLERWRWFGETAATPPAAALGPTPPRPADAHRRQLRRTLERRRRSRRRLLERLRRYRRRLRGRRDRAWRRDREWDRLLLGRLKLYRYWGNWRLRGRLARQWRLEGLLDPRQGYRNQRWLLRPGGGGRPLLALRRRRRRRLQRRLDGQRLGQRRRELPLVWLWSTRWVDRDATPHRGPMPPIGPHPAPVGGAKGGGAHPPSGRNPPALLPGSPPPAPWPKEMAKPSLQWPRRRSGHRRAVAIPPPPPPPPVPPAPPSSPRVPRTAGGGPSTPGFRYPLWPSEPLRPWRRPRRCRRWPAPRQRYRLRRGRRNRRPGALQRDHTHLGAMKKWFRKVEQTWRRQRQRQWRQRRKGEVGAPLLQYHLTANRYYPRLDRQQRRRSLSQENGLGSGAAACRLREGLPSPLGRAPLENRRLRRRRISRSRRLRRRWVEPLPEPTQKGRFVWSKDKHPLLASHQRLKRRAKKQTRRLLRRSLRRRLGGPRPRPDQPKLLPMPGTAEITEDRRSRWRRARRWDRHHWWHRWRERERWYWRLCRWAGLNHKGPPAKQLFWKTWGRVHRAHYAHPWGYGQHRAMHLRLIGWRFYYRNRWPLRKPRGLWTLQRRLRWSRSRTLEEATHLRLAGSRRRWHSGLGRGWRQLRGGAEARSGRCRRHHRRRRRPGFGPLRSRGQPLRLRRRFGQLRDRRRTPRRLRRWLRHLPRPLRRRLAPWLPPLLAFGRRRRHRRKPAHLNRRLGSFRRQRRRRGLEAFRQWRRRRRRLWQRTRTKLRTPPGHR